MINFKKKIFLCYASEDSEVAERIHLSLVNEKFRVFFDEKSLPPAGDYDSRIYAAIDQCDLFIFLITKNSIAPGKYTLTELRFAREKWESPIDKVLSVNLNRLPANLIPSYLSAATMLSIQGNAPSEVRAVVKKMLKVKIDVVKIALFFVFALLVYLFDIGNYVFVSNTYTHPSGQFDKQGEMWIEYPPYAIGNNFYFKEDHRDGKFIYLYDETRYKEGDPKRIFYMRIPISEGMAEWSYPNPFYWQPLYYTKRESWFLRFKCDNWRYKYSEVAYSWCW